MQIFLSLAILTLCIELSFSCALPFWWSEQFHFPPYYPAGQPKSTYNYHETFHHSAPNNFVHIQEFSEYTWWEHDTSKIVPANDYPQSGFDHGVNNVYPVVKDVRPQSRFGHGVNNVYPAVKGVRPQSGFGHGINNAYPAYPAVKGVRPQSGFGHGVNNAYPAVKGVRPQSGFGHGVNNAYPAVKDVRFPVWYPPNQHGYSFGIVHNTKTHNTNNIVPKGDHNNTQHNTNNIVPRGDNVPVDTNNIVPADKTDRISPPSDETNGMTSPEDTTIQSTTVTDSVSEEREERERNENEDLIDVTRIDNMDGNNLEAGSETRATYKLPEENKKSGNFLSGWFGTKNTNETEPCKVTESDINSLRGMIEKMFSLPREHEFNPESKEKAREDILNKFRNLGLQVWTQNFTTPPMKNENGTEEGKDGVNLVGVIPGSLRGRLDDEIVLVGAHYDTVADSNGVDDNGSGLAVMLEVAKAITEARCRLNHTLMFVAFDHEENGAMGSNYFVDHYLIPEELQRARARFQGAFILDGILNYNDIPNSQELPQDYAENLPGLQYFVNNTGNRGNFLAMISRNEVDNHLSQKLMDAWQDLGDHQYKLFNLVVDMGNEIPSPPVIEKHLNFLRSDHATFWYHNSSSHFPESLNAVLLTDTGPYRGQMKECYHNKCDDLRVLSPEKLQFAKKTADALSATLVELTRATALGNQIHPMPLLYALHALILYFTIKICFY